MRPLALLALFVASSLVASAAEAQPEAKTQNGRLSTVRLLATARASGKAAPDGMRFLFLVTPSADATGKFTLKETRDFLLAGDSYQEKTQAELGKRFEPGTVFDTAEGFFTKQPGLRRLAPAEIKGAYILSIAIGGAKLSPGAKADITLHVGFGQEVEPFTFRAAVPPDPTSAAKT